MQIFKFEAPNHFGLLWDSESSTFGPFVTGSEGIEVACPDIYDQFFQYQTKEAAFAKALELDPNYSKNNIFGPIKPEKVDSSPEEITAAINQEIILFCDFTCESPEATFTYQWYDPQNLPIPGATTNIFTFTPKSTLFEGAYSCNVKVEAPINWTGESGISCNVKLLPAPLF